jgi:hypothetical protein
MITERKKNDSYGSTSVRVTIRKEYDLQKIASWKAFIQSQEFCGMVTVRMWNKGTKLGMKMCREPIQRLQCMQQLLTSLASQLICLNLPQHVCEIPEY